MFLCKLSLEQADRWTFLWKLSSSQTLGLRFTIIHLILNREWQPSIPCHVLMFDSSSIFQTGYLCFGPNSLRALLSSSSVQFCSHTVQVKDNAVVTMLTFTCFTQPPPWHNTFHTHKHMKHTLALKWFWWWDTVTVPGEGNKRKWLLVISHLWYTQLCSSSNLSDGFPDSWDVLAPRGHRLHATLNVQQ